MRPLQLHPPDRSQASFHAVSLQDCGKRFSVRRDGDAVLQTRLSLVASRSDQRIPASERFLEHRDLDGRRLGTLLRIRKGLNLTGMDLCSGPVEADEAYLGGKRKNMPKAKRAKLEGSRWKDGRGCRQRCPSNQVSARVVPASLKPSPVSSWSTWEKMRSTPIPLTVGLSITVRHSLQEYVKGNCHTNGAESFWSMLKRSYHGTFHHFSEQHSDRYVGEFAARHNLRRMDTGSNGPGRSSGCVTRIWWVERTELWRPP